MTSFSDQYIINIYPANDINELKALNETTDTIVEDIIPLIHTFSIIENAPILNPDVTVDKEDVPELDEVPFLGNPSLHDVYDSPDEHDDPPPLMPPVKMVRSMTSCPRAAAAAEGGRESYWDQFQQDMPPKMVRKNTVVLSSEEDDESAFTEPFFVWEFETTDGWHPCNVVMALRCEEEHLRKPIDLTVTFNLDDYSLDLLNGTQTNLRTGSLKKIRRRVSSAGVETA
jgi:hypothetical protein